MENTPPKSAIKTAADVCGGVTALANAIGTGQSTVSNWILRGRVPANRCLSIEQATGGRVTCYDLRPDVFRPPENPKATAA